MTRGKIAVRQFVCLTLMLVCLMPTIGCVGLFANFLNVMGAGLIPPAYAGLKDKKVAVVCVSNSQLFGPTSTSTELSREINRLLKTHVRGIELVSTQRIDDWMDQHDWNMVDFVEIGRGVEAEMVVAIDVESFSLHDWATMFKGRSMVHLVVYDTQSGQEVFAASPPQIEFPTTAGVSATSTSETEFRRLFIKNIAQKLARNFYAFDINEDVARDVVTMSRI